MEAPPLVAGTVPVARDARREPSAQGSKARSPNRGSARADNCAYMQPPSTRRPVSVARPASIGHPSGLALLVAVIGVATAVVSVTGQGPGSRAGVLAGTALLVVPLVLAGVAIHRPSATGGWVTIVTGSGLLVAAWATRVATGAFGPAAPDHSVAPDVLAVVGEALLMLGATWLVRVPGERALFDPDLVIDAVIVGLVVSSAVWAFAIGAAGWPASVPVLTRVVEVAVPAADAYMVAVIGMGLGRALRRAPAGQLLVVSFLMLLGADVVSLLDEIGTLRGDRFVALPYVAAAVALALAAVHPGMARTLRQARTIGAGSPGGRLVVAAGAAAVLVALIDVDGSTGQRVGVGAIALAAVVLATWRVVRVLRSSGSTSASLAHLSTHDPLTGLPNRTMLEDWLAARAAQGRGRPAPLAVIFLDIDRFKLVNDTLGYAYGDRLLVAVGERLQAAVGGAGLVARIGGDEFVVAISKVKSVESARREAERLRECLRPRFALGDSEVLVVASAGVAISESASWNGLARNDRSAGPAELISDADMAMNRAKEAGGDTVTVYDPAMRERIADRLALEHDLRRALEREEFVVMYQPVVRLADSATPVVGLEALLRWDQPTRGLVPASLFVATAEAAGLMVEIGDWVIRHACRSLVALRAGGVAEDVFVSVNVSALQLRSDSLLSRVRGALAESGLDPQSLCIELSEPTLLSNPAEGAALLLRLRSLGIRVAIDDFVKIERSFVQALTAGDPAAETFVAAIASMAQALDAVTVAEGVEHEHQERFLRSIGVELAQGYRYARAVPEDAVLETIRRLAPRRGLRLLT